MTDLNETFDYEKRYHNDDLAPIQPQHRTWRTTDFLVIWISMVTSIATYMCGSSLIAEGMNWWQAVAVIFLSSVLLLIPMFLNAHVGVKYGIPFPIYCRLAWGVRGANIPAMLRALVACGWFGIYLWLGASSLYSIFYWFSPHWLDALPKSISGINIIQLLALLIFALVHFLIIRKGIRGIRILLNIKAPILLVAALVLFIWAIWRAHGFGPIFSQPSAFIPGGAKAGQFWIFFVPAVTAMMADWSTVALNITDFTRYSKNQLSQVVGQGLGLPFARALLAFVGIAVTSATVVIFGKAIWNPVDVVNQIGSPMIIVVGAVIICIAAVATNLAANVVSTANDFSHLWPQKISFKTGGYITIVIGILMQPWKIIANPNGFIFMWLLAYAGLIGTLSGIAIADYYLIRKTKIKIAELYQSKNSYWYFHGFNPVAIIAFGIAIAPCLPGFLGTVGLVKVSDFWLRLYHYSWFVNFFLALVIYPVLYKVVFNAKSTRKS